MNLIPSFQINHEKLEPGIYVSRIDKVKSVYLTTFDIRVKAPNKEPALTPAASHTIEHLAATFLRNDPKWKNKIIYFGPMGCLTGFYLIVGDTKKYSSFDIRDLIYRTFMFIRDYDGKVPGTTAKECGNYTLHDLNGAKEEAETYLTRLSWQNLAGGSIGFQYPTE